MIEITRKGTQITISVHCPKNNYTYYFNYECGEGREDYAILLSQAMKDGFWDVLKEIRRESYAEGWKDAKKKSKKRDYFWGGLK